MIKLDIALSRYFRVNGAPLYARGGNKIPMDLLEGRMTAVGHRRLVQSAADAHFTMLRLWGGSIWEPRAFYDACDELGILLCVLSSISFFLSHWSVLS